MPAPRRTRIQADLIARRLPSSSVATCFYPPIFQQPAAPHRQNRATGATSHSTKNRPRFPGLNFSPIPNDAT